MPTNIPLPTKAKIDRVGVQRPQPAERDELKIEVRVGEKQLDRAKQSRGHADHAPNDGGNGKRADDAVVIFERLHLRASCRRGNGGG